MREPYTGAADIHGALSADDRAAAEEEQRETLAAIIACMVLDLNAAHAAVRELPAPARDQEVSGLMDAIENWSRDVSDRILAARRDRER